MRVRTPFLAGVLLSMSLCTPLLADGAGAQHFRTGLAYERLGRINEAYTELQLAYALEPENAMSDLALGILACRLGRLEIAQRALEQSISLQPNSISAYFHLGLVYERNGVASRALDAWQRFISMTKDDTLKIIAKKHIQSLELKGAM